MHAIKKPLVLLTLTFFVVIVCLTLYVISPHTYTTDVGPNYSDRYYELSNKKTLTEEERAELLEERKKIDTAAFKEYESKYLNDKEE